MKFDWLERAIEAFSNDDATSARTLLQAYTAEHPRDEKGWYWMSRVAERPSEKRAYLKRILELRFARA
jgi:hypothetical protein